MAKRKIKANQGKPRATRKRPKYCGPHTSGKAYVWQGKKAIYFPGEYGSPESLQAYQDYLAELADEPLTHRPTLRTCSLAELANEFRKARFERMSKQTKSQHTVLFRHLLAKYPKLIARDFGPLRLQAFRTYLTTQKVGKTSKNWSRRHVNEMVRRLIRVFRWGVAQELVDPMQLAALEAVEPLKRGESEARETEPKRPVQWSHVQASMAAAYPIVRAMIHLQWLTGMRSSNLCDMRAADIDCSGEIWLYVPAQHKNDWRGKNLFVTLGPRAQAVIFPFLFWREPTEHLFSPRETARLQSAARWAARRSPKWVSAYKKRNDTFPHVRSQYDAHSYRQAVHHACRKADIPLWTPHQIRHALATSVRKKYGIEAARVYLGHSSVTATQIYAQRDLELALEVARDLG